jgi:hypothetical protein
MPGSKGYAGYKASHWWKIRTSPESIAPASTKEFMKRKDEIKKAKKIFVSEKGKFPTIIDVEF